MTKTDQKPDNGVYNTTQKHQTETPRRLLRDPVKGYIAGVAQGLGEYMGVDSTIIRIIFVLGTIFGGWGLLVYIVLWICMPTVQSPADREQLRGKPLTVQDVKDQTKRIYHRFRQR